MTTPKNTAFDMAWLILIVGTVIALVVGNAGCGHWGLTCIFYGFLVFAAASTVSTILFWRAFLMTEPGSWTRQMSGTMGVLTSLVALVGLMMMGMVTGG